MAAAARRCCRFLGGRPADDAPLLGAQCGREVAASSGLRQLQEIRRQCEALAPALRTAAGGAGDGDVALAYVCARLGDLEEVFRAASAPAPPSGRPGGLPEVWNCLVRFGDDRDWAPHRVAIGDTELALEDAAAVGRDGSPVRVPWAAVEDLEVRQLDGPSWCDALLKLRLPLGRVQLQYLTDAQCKALGDAWRGGAAQGGAAESCPDAEVLGWAALRSNFERSGGELTVQARHLSARSLRCRADGLGRVRELLLRSDEGCAVARLWREQGVGAMRATSWQPLGPDGGPMVRLLHFDLPLKPRPFAPPRTRFSIVYCLSGDLAGGGRLLLSEMSRSFDAPCSFTVQCQSAFVAKLPPGHDDAVIQVESCLAVEWEKFSFGLGTIVESEARREGEESRANLLRLLGEDLQAAGCC